MCVLYGASDVSDLTGGFYGNTGFERSQAHFWKIRYGSTHYWTERSIQIWVNAVRKIMVS